MNESFLYATHDFLKKNTAPLERFPVIVVGKGVTPGRARRLADDTPRSLRLLDVNPWAIQPFDEMEPWKQKWYDRRLWDPELRLAYDDSTFGFDYIPKGKDERAKRRCYGGKVLAPLDDPDRQDRFEYVHHAYLAIREACEVLNCHGPGFEWSPWHQWESWITGKIGGKFQSPTPAWKTGVFRFLKRLERKFDHAMTNVLTPSIYPGTDFDWFDHVKIEWNEHVKHDYADETVDHAVRGPRYWALGQGKTVMLEVWDAGAANEVLSKAEEARQRWEKAQTIVQEIRNDGGKILLARYPSLGNMPDHSVMPEVE